VGFITFFKGINGNERFGRWWFYGLQKVGPLLDVEDCSKLDEKEAGLFL
jgi:hypothetical protein